MKTNLKSAYIPQDNQKRADSDYAERGKNLTLQVQTSIRAGWVPGQYAREGIRNFRASLPDWFMEGEIR
jgi:hypothetical protein